MGSRKEIIRLVFAMLGALAGLAIGLALMMFMYQQIPALAETYYGAVHLFAILIFCGGGLMGGGYLVLTIQNRIERKRKKAADADKKRRKKSRK